MSDSFLTPWTAARQASLSFITSRSLLKHLSIELVMPKKFKKKKKLKLITGQQTNFFSTFKQVLAPGRRVERLKLVRTKMSNKTLQRSCFSVQQSVFFSFYQWSQLLGQEGQWGVGAVMGGLGEKVGRSGQRCWQLVISVTCTAAWVVF